MSWQRVPFPSSPAISRPYYSPHDFSPPCPGWVLAGNHDAALSKILFDQGGERTTTSGRVEGIRRRYGFELVGVDGRCQQCTPTVVADGENQNSDEDPTALLRVVGCSCSYSTSKNSAFSDFDRDGGISFVRDTRTHVLFSHCYWLPHIGGGALRDVGIARTGARLHVYGHRHHERHCCWASFWARSTRTGELSERRYLRMNVAPLNVAAPGVTIIDLDPTVDRPSDRDG